jgi:hypothetical protein
MKSAWYRNDIHFFLFAYVGDFFSRSQPARVLTEFQPWFEPDLQQIAIGSIR